MQAVWVCETNPTLNISGSQPLQVRGASPWCWDITQFSREFLWHRNGDKTVGSQLFWRPGHFSHLRQPPHLQRQGPTARL